MIDQNARNCFNVRLTTMSMIKYAYSFNHHTIRDKIINYRITVKERPHYSRKEM